MDPYSYSLVPSHFHDFANSSYISNSHILFFKTTSPLLWATTTPPPALSTKAMSSDPAMRQWTLVLVLTASFLSLVVVAQIVTRYGAAYWAAPREMAALLDSADSSLQENESYDRDVVKVPHRDDKIRLGRLLQEIQRAGDDLREDLNSILALDGDDHGSGKDVDDVVPLSGRFFDEKQVQQQQQQRRRRPALSGASDGPLPGSVDRISSYSTPRLKLSARILWAAKRTRLEERLRRIDLLRMRFLVVYMSIVAATATAAAERVEKSATAASIANARNSSRTSNSRSSSSSSSCSSSTCSSSGSSVAGSPLMSATPSMPSSPRSPQKTTSSIVAASIAAAAAAAIASGDTDGKYFPTPSPPATPETPSSHGRPHPFLRSIQRQRPEEDRQAQHQLKSPPATPKPSAAPSPDDLTAGAGFRRKPPSRRVTTLGIRPPEASPENNHRAGWLGVVQELQKSPLLHKRHTSIEMSMARQ